MRSLTTRTAAVQADGTQLPILKSVVRWNTGVNNILSRASLISIVSRSSSQELSQLNEKLKNSYHDLQERNEELKALCTVSRMIYAHPFVNIKGFSAELGNSLRDINALMNKCAFIWVR